MTEMQSVSSIFEIVMLMYFLQCNDFVDRTGETDSIAATVDYFSLSLEYNSKVKILDVIYNAE